MGWIKSGEWLEYQVDLAGGVYQLNARVASLAGGGKFTALIDGEQFAEQDVASTDDWQNWLSLESGTFLASAGQHSLRINIDSTGLNLNWFELTQLSADQDADGIEDKFDACADTPKERSVDELGCLNDADEDGISDEFDQCDNTLAEAIVDEDGCNIDEDLDGVINSQDLCPDTPIQSFVDEQGCIDESTSSPQALNALQQYLADPLQSRSDIKQHDFYSIALNKTDASTALTELWQDRRAYIRATRQAEVDNKLIENEGVQLKYRSTSLGNENSEQRSLFISMHGGGGTTTSANDGQWSNQLALANSYKPQDALWIAPRAPTDAWNMWSKSHIDPLFDQLISNMIVFENIDPSRIYLTGYSAGGDGVYQLAPRMADRWAGAQMSAGHPNGIPMDNIRNLAFALHMGADDSAYNRNTVAQEYIDKINKLHNNDPEGYTLQGRVHQGYGHWMGMQDAIAIPFIQKHTRDPDTNKVVWLKRSTQAQRFYWLGTSEKSVNGARVTASIEGQTITLETLSGFNQLNIYLNDEMVDLDQELNVVFNDEVLFSGKVARSIEALYETLNDREDPAMMYKAKISLDIK